MNLFSIVSSRYYRPRMRGLETQVFTLSLALTTTYVVLFYSRKKMPFKFKVLDHLDLVKVYELIIK